MTKVMPELTPVECPVCLEVARRTVECTSCKKVFCVGCIEEWFAGNDTCPTCRRVDSIVLPKISYKFIKIMVVLIIITLMLGLFTITFLNSINYTYQHDNEINIVSIVFLSVFFMETIILFWLLLKYVRKQRE